MKKTLVVSASIALVLSLFAGSTELTAADGLKSAGCKTEYHLMKDLVAAYQEKSGENIQVGKTGNKKAVELLADEKIDFTFTCKPISKLAKKFGVSSDTAADWSSVPIAKDPLIVVVREDTGIKDLTSAQISKIFAGQSTNWNENGGPDLPIKIAYLDSSKVDSGAQSVFLECTLFQYLDPVTGEVSDTKNQELNKEAKLTSDATLLDAPDKVGFFCKNTPGGITFMSLREYRPEFGTAIKVNGIEPTRENIESDKYAMAVTYYLDIPKDSEMVMPFLDFVNSPDGQEVIDSMMIAIPAQ